MTKKIVGLLLCIAMFGALLVGCGGNGVSADVDNPSTNTGNEGSKAVDGGIEADPLRTDEGTKISIAHCQGEYIYETFNTISDKFTEQTGIEVEWIELPSADYDTWVTAQFAAGTEPDITWNASKDYFDQGKLFDLTEYYEQKNVFNGKIWKDCFTEGALTNCMSNDGTKYISTAMTGFSCNLYYNKDIMQELGLGTEAPQTFSQMIEMMEVCKKDGTYIPMSVQNANDVNVGWMERYFIDALFHDTDVLEKLDIIVPNGRIDESEAMLGLKTGVLTHEDPRFVEYFRLMKELTQYWNEDFNAVGWEYEGLFNSGKVLFNINGGWYPGQVVQNGYNVNYGSTVVPCVDDEYAEYGLSEAIKYAAPEGEATFFVSRKCADEGRADAAVKFLQFMTCPEGGAQMYIDSVMLASCIKGVQLPEEVGSLANVEYGDAKNTWISTIYSFNNEAYSKYRDLYIAYLDPSSAKSASDLVADMKAEIMPFLDEAIEESTDDILSYVERVK